MTHQQDAIDDCRHALKLGENVLEVHLEMWEGFPPVEGHPDFNYWIAVNEVREKLHTDECLLRDWKA